MLMDAAAAGAAPPAATKANIVNRTAIPCMSEHSMKMPAALPRRAAGCHVGMRTGGKRKRSRLSHGYRLSARHQDGVDHVDDAVRLEHVLDRHFGHAALGVHD